MLIMLGVRVIIISTYTNKHTNTHEAYKVTSGCYVFYLSFKHNIICNNRRCPFAQIKN